jgi:ectoine hydroxylase-related dioxygenase (phytanoyl-CoA dioxygenase family)
MAASNTDCGELDELRVVGETTIGWDAGTPPNETVDAEGNPFPADPGFGQPDPRAPTRRSWDDPGVVALRERLTRHNGIVGLEICAPDEVERAARIFRRDGFVVVRDLLDEHQLDAFRQASARVLRAILAIPGFDGRKYVTETNRLPHRYSYGTSSASRQLLHDPVWASMIDLPTTTPILAEIFASNDYHVWGAGGDLCLPGAIEYQHLHQDRPEPYTFPTGRLAHARTLGIGVADADDAPLSARHQRLMVELCSPMVTINFLMSDLTRINGPIRQIPGTHTAAQRPPTLAEEPEWMRLSTLVGAPAGAGVFRDNRAWHGATPNLSREIRAMPNVEYVAPWTPAGEFTQTMPHELWSRLSAHARHVSRQVVAPPGVWPVGAGVMHPLLARRLQATQG